MKKNIIKIKGYFEESWRELKKVNWLTKTETRNKTLRVLFLAFVIAVLYSFVDFGLLQIIKLIIK